MASFYAELHLEGAAYRVVHCTYACQQATDGRGRVQAKVRHSPLQLVLDVPEGDALLAWAATPHKPLAGEVVFYDMAQHTAHETIAFTAGECVHYGEQFASGATGDGAYVCQLTIAATSFELRAGGPAGVGAVESAVAAVGTPLAPATTSTLVSPSQAIGGEETGSMPEPSKKVRRPPHELYATAKALNPTNSDTNCSHIVEAFIARSYGIDPEAVAPSAGTRTIKELKDLFNVDLKFDTDFYKAFNAMRDTPEGTIGLLTMIPKKPGMGHIVAIVNHRDGPAIVEAQHLNAYNPVEIITDPTRAIRRYCQGDEDAYQVALNILPPRTA